MKKIFITIFLAILMLPIAAYALEIDFPAVGGIKPEPSFGPANWINYIFVFGLAVVGLAIIGSLVYAGFEWMTGAENPSKIQSAKDRILGSVIGLVILLGSYVFLNTINPQLVSLKNPRIMLNIESGWRDFYKPSEDIGTGLIGDPCTSSEECTTKICGTAGKCTASAGKIGGECTLDRTCDSGNCVNQQSGEPITTSNKFGVCTKKTPNGTGCSLPSECFSGNCVDNLCAPAGISVGQTTVTKIGDPCDANNVCKEEDGLYCNELKQCYSHGLEGNLCKSNSHCHGDNLICSPDQNNPDNADLNRCIAVTP